MRIIFVLALTAIFGACENTPADKCTDLAGSDFAAFDSMTIISHPGFTFVKYTDNYKITRNSIYQDTVYPNSGRFDLRLPDSLVKYAVSLLDSIPNEILQKNVRLPLAEVDAGSYEIVAYRCGDAHRWNLMNGDMENCSVYLQNFMTKLNWTIDKLRIFPPDTLKF